MGDLEVVRHLLVDRDGHLALVLLLVVELAIDGAGAEDNRGDHHAEDQLGDGGTAVHAFLVALKLFLLPEDVCLDTGKVFLTAEIDARGIDAALTAGVRKVVQLAALSRPLSHRGADGLEHPDRVRVITTEGVVLHAHRGMERGADGLSQHVVPIKERARLGIVVVLARLPSFESADLVLVACIIGLNVDVDVSNERIGQDCSVAIL